MNNYLSLRKIHSSICHSTKSQLVSLKGKKKSSQEWLIRQMNDKYVEKAKMEHYRCRSAFKLIQIDNKHKILKPGSKVIDIGASPGSWTQVAIPRVNADGRIPNMPIGSVIAIDLQPLYPIPGATIFGNMDFTKKESQDIIKEHLASERPNVILSDMAPRATGIASIDQHVIMDLIYSVLRFAVEVSEPNTGVLLVKLWANGRQHQYIEMVRRFYKRTNYIKPDASRSDSAELFLLATCFRGLASEID